MKVALLTSHLSDSAGGLSECVRCLAGALAAIKGVAVRVIGIDEPDADDGWRAWSVDVRPCRRVGPPAFGWAPSLRRALADFDPDVIDAQGLWMYPSLAGVRWHRRTRRPYLVTPHGMLDPWALRRSVWKKRLARWWYQDAHLREASCLRATSVLEASHFRALGLRNPIVVVANGIEAPASTAVARPPSRRRRLLFLSRIHPKKGIDFLLRAWTRVQCRHDDWELVIAGPDELQHRSAMQALAGTLGAARIVWQGPVYGLEKSALYRSADVFVLPTHAENFGLVIGEALAHEVPVITTRNAPWDGLLARRCGWWIDLTDDQLAGALDMAMGLGDEERRVMGVRGRQWVETTFSWSAIGRQMLNAYRWILEGGSPPDSLIAK